MLRKIGLLPRTGEMAGALRLPTIRTQWRPLKMAKLGRKKLPEEQRRQHPITCRLTDNELDELEAKKPQKMPNGEFIRFLALSQRLKIKKVPAVNQTLRGELGRIGNNINQIAWALNSGRDVQLDHVINVLIALQAKLATIRRELAG